MKVKELISMLKNIENKEAEICFMGNIGHPEDETTDIYFDFIEIWDDGDQSITLFSGLSEKKLKQIKKQYEHTKKQKRVLQ